MICSCWSRDISGRSKQVGCGAERSQRRSQLVDELRDQVGLLEQARILNGNCRLCAQHGEHGFIARR